MGDTRRQRYTPINDTASIIANEAVYVDEERNSKRFKNYFRADIKLNYKLNTKNLTHEIGLDLVNIFDVKNILRYVYVPGGEPLMREDYQLGFLPIFYYKIDF